MKTRSAPQPVNDAIRRLLEGRHHDPFEVLGCHREGEHWLVRALLPGAAEVELLIAGSRQPHGAPRPAPTCSATASTARRHPCTSCAGARPGATGSRRRTPIVSAPTMGDLDLHLFGEGRHQHVYRVLGAHCCEHEGVAGVRFATWAPNAQRVSVVGDFNQWHGLRHPMRARGLSGVWELFIPGLGAGGKYKFEVLDANGALQLKADPYGNQFELRPATAAIVNAPSDFQWGDGDWLARARELGLAAGAHFHLRVPPRFLAA